MMSIVEKKLYYKIKKTFCNSFFFNDYIYIKKSKEKSEGNIFMTRKGHGSPLPFDPKKLRLLWE